MRKTLAATLGMLVACARPTVDLSGRPCTEAGECATGYVCDRVRNICEAAGEDVCRLGSDRDCTACGDDCSKRPNVVAGECTSEIPIGCVVMSCAVGWADVDLDPNNGCEACAPDEDSLEKCGDGRDNDCDGDQDEDGAVGCTTVYADSDGDSFGTASTSVCLCSPRSGYVANATDCDDNPSACGSACHPGAVDICDTYDNDCSGGADPAGALGCTTFYVDGDGDSVGSGAGACLCAASLNYPVSVAGDCDDTLASIYPGAGETCGNLVDDDCTDVIDDAPNCPLGLDFYTAANSGMASDSITALGVDTSTGRLWVGFSNGSTVSTLGLGEETFSGVTGLKSTPTVAIVVDSSGGTWVAHDEPGCDTAGGAQSCQCGPELLTPSAGSFSKQSFCTDYMSQGNNGVLSIFEQSPGEMVFGTYDDYAVRTTGAIRCDIVIGNNVPTRAMAPDPSDSSAHWQAISGSLNGLVRAVPDFVNCGNSTLQSYNLHYDATSGSDFVDNLSVLAARGGSAGAADDLLWVGSFTYGLLVLNTATLSTSRFSLSRSNFPSDDIRALALDEAGGYIWIGTQGQGLVRLTLDAPYSWLQWLTEDGLPSATITALAIDPARNTLWIGTPAGLVRGYLP